MSILRVAFDNLIEAIPEMRDHLATDSNIVYSRDFENGVVKLQRNSESRLLPREKEALQCFLIDPNAADEANVEQGASLIEELQRYSARQLQSLRKKHRQLNTILLTMCVAIL